MKHLVIEKKLYCSATTCLDLFWDICKWNRFWEPIQKTTVIYNDGAHQEFLMDLNWEGGRSQIRTIRFLNPLKNIDFFSPNPPSPMTQHQGSWNFIPCSDTTCILQAKRSYVLHSRSRKKFHTRFKSRISKLLDQVGEWCQKEL